MTDPVPHADPTPTPDPRLDPSRPVDPEREIVIVREVAAPRDLVWKAWTEPEHIERWWGPEGFSARVDELELRAGGRSRIVMIGPDGTEYPGEGTYLRVDPPACLISTDEFAEGFDLGEGVELPQNTILAVTFEALDPARTRITIRITHVSPEEMRTHAEMGVVAGWESMLGCLEGYLAEVG